MSTLETEMTATPYLLGDTPDATRFRLDDGRTIQLGQVTAASRPLIEQAMLRLSPLSSRRRFFTVRYRLSERELDELTNPVDPQRLAIGASAHFPDGRVEGVGVARFVRVDGAPNVAELAVTVIDDYQKLGVGRRLLQRIGWEARQHGVQRLSGVVLSENVPMLKLLERHVRGLVRRVTRDHLVHVELPLVGA
jgi:GNAT superfamily N-acetyltransferase